MVSEQLNPGLSLQPRRLGFQVRRRLKAQQMTRFGARLISPIRHRRIAHAGPSVLIGKELLEIVWDIDLGNCFQISRCVRASVLRLRSDNLSDEQPEFGDLELEVED